MLVEIPPLQTSLQAGYCAEPALERLFPSQFCLVSRILSLMLGPGPCAPTCDRVPWVSEV